MSKHAATLMMLTVSVSWSWAAPVVLDDKLHHLGDNTVKDWAADATAESEGRKVTLAFQAERNDRPFTLQIHQRDVDDGRWAVVLNGRPLGFLKKRKAAADRHFSVPKEVLQQGDNTLVIENPRGWKDDILVGRVRLHDASLREVLKLGRVMLRVTDADTGAPVPARLTLVGAQGARPEIQGDHGEHVAVRAGLIYTLGVETAVELPAGSYTVYATRGTEWSLGRAEVRVTELGEHRAELTIRREVDTAGFVAADTHIHTLTHSGHGDASVKERVVTLAGEGVELAIATDHNHNTDYEPVQQRLGLSSHYTSVVANEVTTPLGHLNSFPLNPKDPVPSTQGATWTKLVEGIRAKGAKVVILNHPRWPQDKKTGVPAGPFRQQKFHRVIGSFGSGAAFPFDCIEVINSETENSKKDAQPLWVLEEWMTLLNHGETVKAVGSSDSHTVGDPVGQGRTYVKSRTDDPAAIDVGEAVEAFLKGRTTISLGIVTDIRVGGSHGVGDTVQVGGEPIEVKVRVACASWIRPRRVLVYVNGRRVAESQVAVSPDQAVNQWVSFSITPPAHDAHLVAAVLGDPVREPYWHTDWAATMAATNPVYLDRDGDGRYRHPRATAQSLLEKLDHDPARVAAALEREDPVVAVQMVDLIRERVDEAKFTPVRQAVESLADTVPLFRAMVDEGL